MDIEKKRVKCEEKALGLLAAKYAADEHFQMTELALGISLDAQKADPKLYKKDLEAFKYLYHLYDRSVEIALWNSFDWVTADTKFIREDFTREEYDFLKHVLTAYTNRGNETNCNEPIPADRMVLRPFRPADLAGFRNHLKSDGDFFELAGCAPTPRNIRLYASKIGPLYFVMEKKLKHEAIGFVGLSYREETHTAVLEFYVYKPFRKHGYCKEAILALTEKAFQDGLTIAEETERKAVYANQPASIRIVRANMAQHNTPAIKTVQSCGFLYEATLHQNIYREGVGVFDEEFYYLTKAN